MENTSKKRGFALMSPEQMKKLASAGGKARSAMYKAKRQAPPQKP